MVLPVGTAIASTDTVPGDFRYPVKRVVEPVWSVFDSDTAAHHRVDELEKLLDNQAEDHRITDAVSDARLTVTDLPSDHHLQTDPVILTDLAPSDTTPSHQEETDNPSDNPITDKPPYNATTTHTPTDNVPATGAPSDPQSPDHVTTTANTSDSDGQDANTDSNTDSATTDG